MASAKHTRLLIQIVYGKVGKKLMPLLGPTNCPRRGTGRFRGKQRRRLWWRYRKTCRRSNCHGTTCWGSPAGLT